MINVWGDSVGAGIVAHLSRNDLAKEDEKQAPDDLVFGNGHAVSEDEVAGGVRVDGAFVVPTVNDYEQTNM